MVKTLCFHCGGTGLIPGWRAKIPHALWLWSKKPPKLEQTNSKKVFEGGEVDGSVNEGS